MIIILFPLFIIVESIQTRFDEDHGGDTRDQPKISPLSAPRTRAEFHSSPADPVVFLHLQKVALAARLGDHMNIYMDQTPTTKRIEHIFFISDGETSCEC